MRSVNLFLGVVLLGTCTVLGAQQPSSPDKASGSAAPEARQQDEKAIAALVAAYTKAFNAGDAAATAATFADDALAIDEHGERTEGRAAIRDQLAASFTAEPRTTIGI